MVLENAKVFQLLVVLVRNYGLDFPPVNGYSVDLGIRGLLCSLRHEKKVARVIHIVLYIRLPFQDIHRLRLGLGELDVVGVGRDSTGGRDKKVLIATRAANTDIKGLLFMKRLGVKSETRKLGRTHAMKWLRVYMIILIHFF